MLSVLLPKHANALPVGPRRHRLHVPGRLCSGFCFRATGGSRGEARFAGDAGLRAGASVGRQILRAGHQRGLHRKCFPGPGGKNGKVDYREDSIFDYQLQSNPNSGSLKLVESRDTRKTAFRDSSRTLLITNGFTAMLLVMHPTYESSYTFDPAGQESVDGVTYDKINFKAVPGAASPAALQLRGHNYPLPLSGSLWIEPESGAVEKMVATLDSGLGDLGLTGMRSEIHYALVRFHDPDESYWMPISAVIDVETPRQHWRNIHRFTGYKRFRATIRVEDLEAKP